MNNQDPQKLEAAIHRAVRSLPDRKAPAGLEGRVLAELSRRAALPWWHRSLVYWPAPMRVAFFAGSALAAALLISGLIAFGRNYGAQSLAGVSQPFAWFGAARDFFASINANLRLLVSSISPYWLYGTVGVIAVCYATLAGISAVAYRALSRGRSVT